MLHYSPTHNQRQETNLSALGMFTAEVKFGSQKKKKVSKWHWEMTLLCTYNLKKEFIFIDSFSTTVTMQLSLHNHSTKINTVLSCPQHTRPSLHISVLLHLLILMQAIFYRLVGILISPCLSPCFHTSRLLDRKCYNKLAPAEKGQSLLQLLRHY